MHLKIILNINNIVIAEELFHIIDQKLWHRKLPINAGTSYLMNA
jgi:hypothetical protein